MTEPLDIEAIREQHQRFPSEEVAKAIDDAYRGLPGARPLSRFTCAWDDQDYPCDAVRLCDEVERLRGLAYKRAGQMMARAGAK